MTGELGSWIRTMTSVNHGVSAAEQFLVGWDGVLVGGNPEDVVDGLGRVMDEMLDCDELIDPTLERDAQTETVRFEVIVDAEDVLDAMQKATYLVRSCLHGAGVGTPSWPSADDIERSSLSLRFEHDPSIEHLADA